MTFSHTTHIAEPHYTSAGVVSYIHARQFLLVSLWKDHSALPRFTGAHGDSNKLASSKENCEMAPVISGASLSPL